MIGGLLFLIMRGIQLVTLIPLIGMLAYIVHGYVQDQYFLPNYVLVLFIVSVIAGVWALVTTIFYRSVRKSGHFLALVEIGIFAALIAGVVILRGIAGANCSDASSFNGYPQLYPFYSQWHHVCTILKACFALGIMNILFFFVTFVSPRRPVIASSTANIIIVPCHLGTSSLP